MPIQEVNLLVLKDIVVEGVPIKSADYRGMMVSRPDMNSPGGQKTSYELILPDPISTRRIDVTDEIAVGKVVLV